MARLFCAARYSLPFPFEDCIRVLTIGGLSKGLDALQLCGCVQSFYGLVSEYNGFSSVVERQPT